MKLLFILLLPIFALTSDFTYKLSYFENIDNLSFSQIKTKTYIDIKDNHLNKSFNFNTFWIKVEIKNNSNEKMEKIININNPKIDFIDFYDEESLLHQTGNHRLMSSKEIRDIAFAFALMVQAHSSKVYYFKINTHNSFVMNFSIDNEEEYLKKSEMNKIFLTFFFGFMFSIIIYNLFLFFVLRENIYIYYVLLQLTTLFLLLSRSGLGQYLLWVDNHYISEFISNNVGQLEVIFCLLFVKVFLDLRNNSKRVNFAVNGVMVLAMMALFLGYDSLLLKIFIISSTLFTLCILFFAMKKKIYGSRILFLAFSVFVISGSIIVMVDAGILEPNFFTIHSLYVGSIFEAIVFSIVSGKRIENLKYEKEKALEISYERLNQEVDKKTKQLQEYLKEKDLFIQEGNHRIKNNLQLISSFVNILSIKEKNKKTLENYSALNNKIFAISLIHDKLLKKNIEDGINIKSYIDILINSLISTSNLNIIHKIDVDNVTLDINILTNIGFIINELATNSLKYAFVNSDTADKVISLSLHKKDKLYRCIIKDNGVGFALALDDLESFGLKFVSRIVKNQLGSDLIYKNQNGAYFEFNFKA